MDKRWSSGLTLENIEEYPYIYVHKKLSSDIASLLKIDSEFIGRFLEPPPPHIDYDLAFPLMRYTKKIEEPVDSILEKLREKNAGNPFIQLITIEKGYLNIRFNREKYSKEVLKSINNKGENYGRITLIPKRKVVIEHTSANPVHPLHIGHGRNTSIGDTLARLLEFAGMEINRRFYIDDVGRQTAILIYGLQFLGDPREWKNYIKEYKPDHWMGIVYSTTNLLIELNNLKKEIAKETDLERRSILLQRQDRIVYKLAEISKTHKEVFDKLSDNIMKDEDPEGKISVIIKKYERGEEPYKTLIRKAVTFVLEGFKETLKRLSVEFDDWDWESDLLWNGLVGLVLEKARKSEFFTHYKDAEAIDFSTILSDETIAERVGFKKNADIPPLIIKRSDGTTLYTTRDIAYSILKFEKTGADYVINVVGKDQILPQTQVRLSLYLLGYQKYASNLIHYSYEMVNLPGKRMSSRMGEYLTLDEVLDSLYSKAIEEIEKRNLNYTQEEKAKIAEIVGMGALRYFLVSVDSNKTLTLNINDIVNFEKNTAPYIQYTHARANGILSKTGVPEKLPQDYKYLEENQLRYRLLKQVSIFPYIIMKAAIELRPDYIVEYLGRLSQDFNKWYDTDPVINDPIEERRVLKQWIVLGIKNVIKNSLNILGVEAPQKM